MPDNPARNISISNLLNPSRNSPLKSRQNHSLRAPSENTFNTNIATPLHMNMPLSHLERSPVNPEVQADRNDMDFQSAQCNPSVDDQLVGNVSLRDSLQNATIKSCHSAHSPPYNPSRGNKCNENGVNDSLGTTSRVNSDHIDVPKVSTSTMPNKSNGGERELNPLISSFPDHTASHIPLSNINGISNEECRKHISGSPAQLVHAARENSLSQKVTSLYDSVIYLNTLLNKLSDEQRNYCMQGKQIEDILHICMNDVHKIQKNLTGDEMLSEDNPCVAKLAQGKTGSDVNSSNVGCLQHLGNRPDCAMSAGYADQSNAINCECPKEKILHDIKGDQSNDQNEKQECGVVEVESGTQVCLHKPILPVPVTKKQVKETEQVHCQASLSILESSKSKSNKIQMHNLEATKRLVAMQNNFAFSDIDTEISDGNIAAEKTGEAQPKSVHSKDNEEHKDVYCPQDYKTDSKFKSIDSIDKDSKVEVGCDLLPPRNNLDTKTNNDKTFGMDGTVKDSGLRDDHSSTFHKESSSKHKGCEEFSTGTMDTNGKKPSLTPYSKPVQRHCSRSNITRDTGETRRTSAFETVGPSSSSGVASRRTDSPGMRIPRNESEAMDLRNPIPPPMNLDHSLEAVVPAVPISRMFGGSRRVFAPITAHVPDYLERFSAYEYVTPLGTDQRPLNLENIDLFFDEVMATAEQYNLGDPQTFHLAKMLLRGRARNLVVTHVRPVSSLNELKELLLRGPAHERNAL